MSELKARTARSIADAEEILELGADCPIEQAQVYLKSEADEVIAKMNGYISHLEEVRRWRKFPDEKPPKYTWCLVSGKSQMGNYIVITDFFEEDDWAENPKLDDGALDIEWWMPLPSAPKEAK